MPYNPVAVSNGILELGFRDGISIDPMKIQKLLFFTHGYYIASTGRPLLDELFQAWKLGPVLPSIYHRLKKFRGNTINEYGVIYDFKLDTVFPPAPPNEDETYNKARDFVWQTYGKWEPMALSSLTHIKEKAWDRTLKKYPGIQGPQIPNEYIAEDFGQLVTNPVT